MPRGLVAIARSGGHCPLRVSGGILCSERGQSRDAFQAIRLEETSPRCNNVIEITCMKKIRVTLERMRTHRVQHIESIWYEAPRQLCVLQISG